MPIMKTLSIRAPWWPWITHAAPAPGSKPVENRNWWTPYRGPVLIHASTFWREVDIKLDMGAARAMARDAGWQGGNPAGLTLDDIKRLGGKVVGIADLVDCVKTHPSPWFVGKFGFILENARPLANPFDAKGATGFFPLEVTQEQIQ